MHSKQDSKDRLKAFTRETSLSRLAMQTQRSDLRLNEVAQAEVAYLQWMCITLLAGPDFRMTFKVHFKTKDSAALAAAIYKTAAEDIQQEQAIDFIREYCNMTTASLKRSLGNCGVDIGVSLPIVTRGYDELFFFSDKEDNNSDHWSLGTDDRKVFVSVLLEIGTRIDLSKLPEKPEDDGGDVEFL